MFLKVILKVVNIITYKYKNIWIYKNATTIQKSTNTYIET